MKQNFFADLEEFMLDKDGFMFVAYLAMFLTFLGMWIYIGSFWFALFFAAVSSMFIGGGTALFVTTLSMMFARRAYDDDSIGSRLVDFLFSLPLLVMSLLLLSVFVLTFL